MKPKLPKFPRRLSIIFGCSKDVFPQITCCVSFVKPILLTCRSNEDVVDFQEKYKQ